MTDSKRHWLIQAAMILPKIQRRMPSIIRQSVLWPHSEDYLYSLGILSGHKERQIWEAYERASTPQQWFDFAATYFPAHQHRAEILDFITFVTSQEPRVVLEIGTGQSGTNFLLGQALRSVELLIAMDLRVRNAPLLNKFCRP